MSADTYATEAEQASSGEHKHSIIPGRADPIALGQRAAQDIADHEERERIREGIEGPAPEAKRESFGIVAVKLATGEWKGTIIGQLPGADGETRVWWAPRPNVTPHEGLVAMAHRKYLEILTRSGFCNAAAARRRAAEAEFYIATVL